jgi:hypothetical protein
MIIKGGARIVDGEAVRAKGVKNSQFVGTRDIRATRWGPPQTRKDTW